MEARVAPTRLFFPSVPSFLFSASCPATGRPPSAISEAWLRLLLPYAAFGCIDRIGVIHREMPVFIVLNEGMRACQTRHPRPVIALYP